MSILIKQAQVVFPGHDLNGKKVDILLEDGIIQEIGSINASAGQIIEADGLMIFPALVDAQCAIGEPGFEYKEDIKSASEAAKNGGFSTLMVLPNTDPIIDNRGQLEFIKERSKHTGVNILPYGALSKGCQGKDLSEMFDLNVAGAIAFTDGKHPISDVNLMKRALEYSKNFEGVVCSFPLDERINPGGMVNESAQNIKLGVKAMPKIAEELMVNRDLYLQAYTNGNLHISTISTEGSVALIAQAKANKQSVTCGVALANLLYNDDILSDFDSVYKTNPVLREEFDRKALIQGLKDGTIDLIVSDHTPENIENKDVEFDHASYGMTMLETALSLINMNIIDDLDWETIVDKMSLAPRSRFGLNIPDLVEDADFEFTLFAPNENWTYNKASKASKSTNNPMWNKELKGKVIRVN